MLRFLTKTFAMKSFIAHRHQQVEQRIQRDLLPCALNWLSTGNDC